jgi:hypothetical protein
MRDRSAAPEPRTATDREVDAATDSYPGTPRWVKIAGIVALGLILLVALLVVATLLGLHSPGGPAGHGV